MNSKDIKTIDVYAKEWFDKGYGNSYFSAMLIINYEHPDEIRIKIPFQYGYGDHYLSVASDILAKELNFTQPFFFIPNYCRDNKIILRNHKIPNCLKREVVFYGK